MARARFRTFPDLILAGALFALAAGLRLHDFCAIPLHGDWAWFLRAVGDLLAGRPPEGLYAYLYTSIPALLFTAAFTMGGSLVAGLTIWAGLAGLAAPLVFWALRDQVGRIAAVLGGAILAMSPVDVRFGRGLESPYLLSTFVALLTLGLLVGSRRHWLGPVLTVLGAAGAAGMHLGFSLFAITGCLVAARDVLRLPSHKILSTVGCLAAGLPFASAVWVLDRSRLQDNLAMRGAAVDAFGDEQLAGTTELLATLPGTVGLPLWFCGVLLASLALTTVLGKRAGQGTRASGDGALPTLGALLVTGLAPFVWMAFKYGYISDDHAAGLLPLVVAVVAVVAVQARIVRSEGAPRMLRLDSWAPSLVLLSWLGCIVASPYFQESLTPHESNSLTELQEALDLRDRIQGAAASAGDSDPWVLVEQRAGFDNLKSRSGPLLNELLRLPAQADPVRNSCFFIVAEGRALPSGLVELPVHKARMFPPMRLLQDIDCALALSRGPEICAALPGGLVGRPTPRVLRYVAPYDRSHLPCLME